MKNLYLLQTDKPSRLWTNNLRRRLELDEFIEQHPTNIAKHIYITSDEEITDVRPHKGKWHLEKEQILNKLPNYLTDLSECKLVILTTDQDLIADGVQAIDDEFLEWFVNNPNCEEVEIHNLRIKNQETGEIFHYRYEIDTPKEKKWDKLNKEFDSALDSEFGSEKFKHPKVFSENGNELFFDEEGKLIKEQTLDEGAEKYAEGKSSNSTFRNTHIRDFKAGADWQSERMYSEEDFKLFARQFYREIKLDKSNLLWDELADKCLEQFKKK
jgi:hypothetical protein